MRTPFASIEHAIHDIKKGKMVILVDDEDRENEGDLIIAAEKINADAVNFMIKYARGLVCLPMSGELIDKLELPMMTEHNSSKFETAFTVSIEARKGVTTGISAHDRARTIQVAIADGAAPKDIAVPGHIFPLRSREGGVFVRAGQTEGSVDLVKLAGLKAAAVICEIMNEDGSMSRLPQLEEFAKLHDLKIVSVDDLILYRLQREYIVDPIATAKLPLGELGEFKMTVYQNTFDKTDHVVLQKGEIDQSQPTLVRVHSQCLTGDTFGSTRCDCGWQLQYALETISEKGGILLYLNQEGRGIGLANKIKAYALQDEEGLDTVEANHRLGFADDQRDYLVGAQILRHLGLTQVSLMTNNPRKIQGMSKGGLDVVNVQAVEMPAHRDNHDYLKAKKMKLGHMLNIKDKTQ